ncbi:MAG: zinc-binding dehydrogenase [Sphingopyxis sp.]|nr:zinc-binding dehydrogenase [Sphingopyxis sp.]
MKAYVFEKAGSPEVLELRDIPAPTLAEGEVRIAVRAFGLNRAETYLRAGKMGPIEGPRVPGIEAVGEVLEDPSGKFRRGERVATAMGGLQFSRTGSYAEEIAVLASNVISLDGIDLSWEELATLPEAYLTIWGALDRTLGLESGQTLLVRGATSSVGLAAVAYAKARGATVIATSRSSSKAAQLRTIGADATVIDDGTIAERVQRLAPGGVDAALEIVGAPTLRDTIKTLRPFGGVAVIGLLAGPPVVEQFHLMQDLPGATRLSFFPSGLLGTPALPLTDAPLRWVAEQIAAQRMPSIASQVFDFSDVRKAHALIESNGADGKLVVRV